MSGNGLGSKPTLGVNSSARRRASAAGTSSSETAMEMGSRSNNVSRTSDSPVCVQEYVHTPIILCRDLRDCQRGAEVAMQGVS